MKAETNQKELIRQFVLESLSKPKNISEIHDEENLIENGVIDSLGIMRLVSHIEGMFTVKVKDEDIIPENFESINAISQYVERLG